MVATRLIIAALLLVLISACSPPPGSFCAVEQPDRDPVSQMTVMEARTALAHNLKGARLCGWTP